MKEARWIIIQRNPELYREDGIRFSAYPLGNDEEHSQLIVNSLGLGKEEEHWIVEEVK